MDNKKKKKNITQSVLIVCVVAYAIWLIKGIQSNDKLKII
jgi:uncharacterized protein with PQ loop repeat